MSEHTPGPWRVAVWYGETCIVADDPGSFQQGVIAVLTTRHEEANARLIAAAPDLLAACEEALWACKGKEYDPDRFDRAAALCKAALAKAKP